MGCPHGGSTASPKRPEIATLIAISRGTLHFGCSPALATNWYSSISRLAASHSGNGSIDFSPQRGFGPFCSPQGLGITGLGYSYEIVSYEFDLFCQYLLVMRTITYSSRRARGLRHVKL